jgi:DNA polymerase-3 subunit alpha
VLAFGETWAKFRDVLKQDAPVLVRGAVSGRERDEEDPPLFLDSAVALEEVRAAADVGVAIELGSAGPEPAALERAKALLAEHAGEGPLLVTWTNGGAEQTRLRSKSLKVAPRDELLAALREVLGDERVRLHREPPPVVSTAREERWGRRGGGGGEQ